MTPLALYTFAGAVIFLLGLWGIAARAHLLWKILGFNLMGSGVFLILLAAPPRLDPDQADPVTQAMVLTGIVVAAAATAVALGMSLRVVARTGVPYLHEDGSKYPGADVEAQDLGGPPRPGADTR